jgi:hypothetical protein
VAGSVLLDARLTAGASRDDAARHVGMTSADLAAIEAGARRSCADPRVFSTLLGFYGWPSQGLHGDGVHLAGLAHQDAVHGSTAFDQRPGWHRRAAAVLSRSASLTIGGGVQGFPVALWSTAYTTYLAGLSSPRPVVRAYLRAERCPQTAAVIDESVLSRCPADGKGAFAEQLGHVLDLIGKGATVRIVPLRAATPVPEVTLAHVNGAGLAIDLSGLLGAAYTTCAAALSEYAAQVEGAQAAALSPSDSAASLRAAQAWYRANENSPLPGPPPNFLAGPR